MRNGAQQGCVEHPLASQTLKRDHMETFVKFLLPVLQNKSEMSCMCTWDRSALCPHNFVSRLTTELVWLHLDYSGPSLVELQRPRTFYPTELLQGFDFLVCV